jgi:tRNA uridine 5-carboxymethylaminomethyl modification enzyme
MGDSFSTLSDSLREFGFEVGRFKTGTPCRLHGKTIDFSKCQPQPGDEPALPFSFVPERLERRKDDIFSLNHWADDAFHMEQLPCWITYTTEKTHDIIRSNLDKSPLYAGMIEGVGPRYCPSIEDKVVKFADKTSHQLFLEPEGRHTEEIYVNGVSTSLPMEVQYAFIRTVLGLENAEIMRPGYAVEYDYCPPTQLFHTLETQRVPRLYFAGQINGTSGYEEAGAQGLIAGANAALKVLGMTPLTFTRADAYLGVLIDDLVTKGTPEPYRMFTSRAEHRLLLRHDNADARLTPLAFEHGLVDAGRWEKVRAKQDALAQLRVYADAKRHEGVHLSQWLRRPDNAADALPAELRDPFPLPLWDAFEIDLKYAGYIARQETAVERLRDSEAKRIPPTLDYLAIPSLRAETRQKLAKVRPETLGQAARISGITPADIALLSIVIQRGGG